MRWVYGNDGADAAAGTLGCSVIISVDKEEGICRRGLPESAASLQLAGIRGAADDEKTTSPQRSYG